MRLRTWAVALSLAVLLLHARLYAFLCDDAFITFRYARNLAQGFGLVFNPGFERVEGYTNFLWVLILAVFAKAGIAPDRAANVLLVLATVALWALVAWFGRRALDEGDPAWTAALAPAFLALSRSVAVWSTSGLETRLFEVLTVAGALRLVVEIEAAPGRTPRRRPLAALLLALAALTRPDGVLTGGAALAVGVWASWRRGSRDLRRVVAQAAVFGGIVAAHFLWRRAYYGAWLPNTYYAKVGGQSWWGMGATYLGAFALEYGAVLWVPLLVLAGVLHRRRGSTHVPAIFAAIVLPHALYVASIGGDHFEYRPLDLYFPFLFLLIADGVRHLAVAARGSARAWAPASAAAVALALVWIPWQSHREFAGAYVPGFPGLRSGAGPAATFLDPGRDPVLRWPVLRSYAEAHRQALRTLTGHFVGVRAEEHRLFRDTVEAEAGRLKALVDSGRIPADTHVALSCVGVIPYRTNLRTLDRLGLTDAVVARSPSSGFRIMAHEKHATFEYAARAGVDFWPEHPVHPILALDDVALAVALRQSDAAPTGAYVADLGDGTVLLGRFPQGDDRGRAKFPALTFASTRDPEARARLDGLVAAASLARARAHPGSTEARLAEAGELARQGKRDEAIAAYRALDDGTSAEAAFGLGTLLGQTGRFDEAVDAFRRAVRLEPDFADAQFNLGVALMRSGRPAEAAEALAEAVRLDPAHAEAHFSLGVAALAMARPDVARAEAEALASLGTPQGAALSERLRNALPK